MCILKVRVGRMERKLRKLSLGRVSVPEVREQRRHSLEVVEAAEGSMNGKTAGSHSCQGSEIHRHYSSLRYFGPLKP